MTNPQLDAFCWNRKLCNFMSYNSNPMYYTHSLCQFVSRAGDFSQFEGLKVSKDVLDLTGWMFLSCNSYQPFFITVNIQFMFCIFEGKTWYTLSSWLLSLLVTTGENVVGLWKKKPEWFGDLSIICYSHQKSNYIIASPTHVIIFHDHD